MLNLLGYGLTYLKSEVFFLVDDTDNFAGIYMNFIEYEEFFDSFTKFCFTTWEWMDLPFIPYNITNPMAFSAPLIEVLDTGVDIPIYYLWLYGFSNFESNRYMWDTLFFHDPQENFECFKGMFDLAEPYWPSEECTGTIHWIIQWEWANPTLALLGLIWMGKILSVDYLPFAVCCVKCWIDEFYLGFFMENASSSFEASAKFVAGVATDNYINYRGEWPEKLEILYLIDYKIIFEDVLIGLV